MIFFTRKLSFSSLLFLLFLLFGGSHFVYSGVSYETGNRRDPLVPLIGPGGITKKAHTIGDFLVEGIIYDPGRESMALVDGELYREGDSIGEAVLISILKDRVIIQQEDQNKTLWIREEIVQGEKNAKP